MAHERKPASSGHQPPFQHDANEVAAHLEYLDDDAPDLVHAMLIDAERQLALVAAFLRCRKAMAAQHPIEECDAVAMQGMLVGAPVTADEARAMQRVLRDHGYLVGAPLRATEARAMQRVLHDHGFHVGGPLREDEARAMMRVLHDHGYLVGAPVARKDAQAMERVLHRHGAGHTARRRRRKPGLIAALFGGRR